MLLVSDPITQLWAPVGKLGGGKLDISPSRILKNRIIIKEMKYYTKYYKQQTP
jgi:hypothetical protein